MSAIQTPQRRDERKEEIQIETSAFVAPLRFHRRYIFGCGSAALSPSVVSIDILQLRVWFRSNADMLPRIRNPKEGRVPMAEVRGCSRGNRVIRDFGFWSSDLVVSSRFQTMA